MLNLTGRSSILILLAGRQMFGQEKALVCVGLALQRVGVNVLFAVRKNENVDVKRALEKFGLRYIEIPLGCLWSVRLSLKKPSLFLSNIHCVIKSSLIIRKIIVDYEVTHLISGNLTATSYLFPGLIGNPVKVVYRHGDEPFRHSIFHRVLVKLIFGMVHQHIANCCYLREILNDNHNIYDVRLIRNIPLDCFTGKPVSKNVHTTKSRDRTSFLYVGQLSEGKGLRLLISTFRQLLKYRKDITLDIVGSFPGIKSVRDSALEKDFYEFISEGGETVRFHGHVNDLADLYVAADCLLVPSIYQDPSPNVIIEAKLYGLASVVFDSGGIAELISHERNGYICHSASHRGFYEAVSWFADNKPLHYQLSIEARNDFDSRFGIERFTKQWLNALAR